MAFLDDKEKPDLDELAHFGVKGMRWGHRKPQETTGGSGGSGGSSGSAPKPKSNRQLNKEFRKSEKAKRAAEIQTARDRYNNSARTNYLSAKAQYKIDKKSMGTAAAKAKFNQVKNKNIQDYNVAAQAKNGKEAAAQVLTVVGVVALSAVLGTAAARR